MIAPFTRLLALGLIASIFPLPLMACNDVGATAWLHLNHLASAQMAGRGPGQPGHALAQHYIEKTFEPLQSYQIGRHQFTYRSGFTHKSGVNWYAMRLGEEPALGYIAITAHYDHLGTKQNNVFYGADDNASGTAAILALAQCLNTLSLRHGVLILAVDREEQGLHGARQFIAEHPDIVGQLRINVNLDMVAHGHDNRHYWLTGTERWPELGVIVEQANIDSPVPFKPRRTLRLESGHLSRGRIDLHRASDHYEFFKAGVPYLFITGENHKHYHQQGDTLASINESFYRVGVQSIAQLILQLDQSMSSR